MVLDILGIFIPIWGRFPFWRVHHRKGLRLGPSLGRQRHWSESTGVLRTDGFFWGGFLDTKKNSWEEHTITELITKTCQILREIPLEIPFPQNARYQLLFLNVASGWYTCKWRNGVWNPCFKYWFGFWFLSHLCGNSLCAQRMGVIWNRPLSKLPVMYSLSWFGGYPLGPRGVPLFCLSPT